MYIHDDVFLYFIGTDRPILKYLNRHVKPNIAPEWFNIGVELLDDADVPVLNGIKTDHPGDSNKCIEKMLGLWLKRKSDVTWNKLIARCFQTAQY